jgi:hypothetical protein
MAWHDEEHHNIFSKFDFVINREIERHESWIKNNLDQINIEIFYPVLVVQGELWRAKHNKENVEITECKHIRYINRTIPKDLSDSTFYYQIDVITEDYLEEYIEGINKQLSEFQKLIVSKSDEFRQAIYTYNYWHQHKQLPPPETILDEIESLSTVLAQEFCSTQSNSSNL